MDFPYISYASDKTCLKKIKPLRQITYSPIRARLALDEEFQVIIETSDNLLRHLPWHLWNFFEDYQKAEVALSCPQYERINSLPKKIPAK